MIAISNSPAVDSNDFVKESKRSRGENNITWVEKNLRELNAPAKFIKLILLGGTSLMDFRLRVAQSQLRHDLTPSSWSHIALMSDLDSEKAENTIIHEISLDPEKGFGNPIPFNGLQKGRLKQYKDVKKYPNIALISFPMDSEGLELKIKNLQMERSSLDLVELILKWLGFIWGVGKTGNPLLEGFGIPSAVMIELIFVSLQFELTPNLPSQNSSPEAIWQAARWWQKFYIETTGTEKGAQGYFYKPHELVSSELYF